MSLPPPRAAGTATAIDLEGCTPRARRQSGWHTTPFSVDEAPTKSPESHVEPVARRSDRPAEGAPASPAELAEENARLREEVARVSRLREEFASVASHELNTPLTALQLNLQWLERVIRRGDDVPAEMLVARLRHASDQVEQLTGLVDTLLHVSVARPDAADIVAEQFDLVGLVRDVVERRGRAIASSGSAIELIGASGVVGTWDRERVEQIVSSLLGNALKYGAGKPITIAVEVGGDADEGVVAITVRDLGMGIAARDQHRIFERFERAVSGRHVSGLGLGLWVVRRNVLALGGNVQVTSRLGEGSTFRVELPRSL